MIRVLKKIITFIQFPGQYFRYKNERLRKIYFLISKFFHLRTRVSRNPKNYFGYSVSDKKFMIDDQLGYKFYNKCLLEENNLKMNDLINLINSHIETNNLKKKNRDASLNAIIKSEDFHEKSEVFKFVTSNFILKIVSKYLGYIPLLTHISVWWSPNDKIHEQSSQFYHLDHEDYKQIKGFLFLSDIDENSGPINAISSNQSLTIQKEISYNMKSQNKRVLDSTIDELNKKRVNKLITKEFLGKKGDLLLMDTSKCFHYGSRKSSKERLILSFQFITPFAYHLKWNWIKSNFIFRERIIKNAPKLIEKIIGKRI
jgi:hypothetical protein